jgi:hypothetical protein
MQRLNIWKTARCRSQPRKRAHRMGAGPVRPPRPPMIPPIPPAQPSASRPPHPICGNRAGTAWQCTTGQAARRRQSWTPADRRSAEAQRPAAHQTRRRLQTGRKGSASTPGAGCPPSQTDRRATRYDERRDDARHVRTHARTPLRRRSWDEHAGVTPPVTAVQGARTAGRRAERHTDRSGAWI